MKYKGLLLESNLNNEVIGDDLYFTFLILDESENYLSNLSGWTFESKLWSLSSSIPSSQISISTSGSKVIVSIPKASTDGLTENIKYFLVIKGTLDSKSYTLIHKEIWFKDNLLD
jgi:hypothetical protein